MEVGRLCLKVQPYKMFQNQNKNHLHLPLNHSLLWVIAITNLMLIATIWYAPTINASYASPQVAQVPIPTTQPTAPTPAPAPVAAAPVLDPYASQYYPMPTQPAYYPAATPYAQPYMYDPYQAGYSYQPPIKFLVGS